jgi:soluble lytic murein transglycosylase-like protein
MATPRDPIRLAPASRAAREIRWLTLSEGLDFCAGLQADSDRRFEAEAGRWLERASASGLLRAAELRVLTKAAHADLLAVARPLIESSRPRTRVRGHRRVPARPSPGALILGASATTVAVALAIVNTGDALPVPPAAVAAAAHAKVHRRATVALPRCPIPARLRGTFVDAAARTRLPLPLLVALARSESRFDDGARSSRGAVGLLQLMPETARALGADPSDPNANVLAGARYLRSLVSRFGTTRLALAAYNIGPTKLAARGLALDGESRAYVAKVTRIWRSVRDCH